MNTVPKSKDTPARDNSRFHADAVRNFHDGGDRETNGVVVIAEMSRSDAPEGERRYIFSAGR